MMQIPPQINGNFVRRLMKHGCISRGSGCFGPRSQRMFDAEGAEITTNIALTNRHKFKLSTDYHYAKQNATSTDDSDYY